MRRPKGSGGSSCRPRRETDRPFQLTAGGETARGAPPRYCELAAAETHIYIVLLTQQFVHSGAAAWDGAWLHLIVSRFSAASQHWRFCRRRGAMWTGAIRTRRPTNASIIQRARKERQERDSKVTGRISGFEITSFRREVCPN